MNAFFSKRKIWITTLLIGLLVITAFKNDTPIILTNEALPYKPKAYYIADVIDERPDKHTLAQVIVKLAPNKTATQLLGMQGGTAQAISKFITQNLAKDVSLTPVTISIKEFKLTETTLANGSIDGQVKLMLSFGLVKNYGLEQLVDYRGGLHYTRAADNMANVEPYLRGALKTGLVYFNNWINANTEMNRKLAKKVNISFTNYSEPNEGDTIYYSRQRPLAWDDFQSKYKPPGKFSAEVMPGFGYDQETAIVKGTINVNITLKVYVTKSTCWTNDMQHSSYALMHEQRHFDIARIIAAQFKQKIAAENLTPDSYEAFINMQYLDSYRDMNTMQKAYDKETQHSLNTAAQNEWDDKIDKELKLLKVIN